MECTQVKKRLDAWADGEMSRPDRMAVDRHLAGCPDCRDEAASLKRLNLALDGLGPVPAPSGFSGRVCRAARQKIDYPDLAQWWRHLSPAWRTAVCSTAMAGLIFGLVLGTSLATGPDAGTSPAFYLATSDDGGYY